MDVHSLNLCYWLLTILPFAFIRIFLPFFAHYQTYHMAHTKSHTDLTIQYYNKWYNWYLFSVEPNDVRRRHREQVNGTAQRNCAAHFDVDVRFPREFGFGRCKWGKKSIHMRKSQLNTKLICRASLNPKGIKCTFTSPTLSLSLQISSTALHFTLVWQLFDSLQWRRTPWDFVDSYSGGRE